MLEIILDALKDSLIIFPFLFLIYFLMEVIENAKKKEKIEKALSGIYAPFAAGALGIVPECGFSVMCAKLFDKGLIRTGTLVAAFISTSDEGLIVLVTEGKIKAAILMVVYKFIFAVVIGVLLNFIFKKHECKHECPNEDDCIECGEHHEKKVDKFFLHPLFHAFMTFLYILLLNFLFGAVIKIAGEESVVEFTKNCGIFQPVIAGLIGLIPNCGSSILLAESYVNGALTFSGLLSGLSVNAGMGLIILFKNGKTLKRNLLILLIMYLSGVLLGFIGMI